MHTKTITNSMKIQEEDIANFEKIKIENVLKN